MLELLDNDFREAMIKEKCFNAQLKNMLETNEKDRNTQRRNRKSLIKNRRFKKTNKIQCTKISCIFIYKEQSEK